MADILLVEDEESINRLVAANLRMMGHSVEQAYMGKQAVDLCKRRNFNLMILDVMLPDMDGFSVLERISGNPTIFLTACDTATNKVQGFTLGADDYITKPFELTELLLRVTAVLRRTLKSETVYQVGGLRVDFGAKQTFINDEPIDLAVQEFNLLRVLIENRNIALSRQRLLTEAWGINFMGESRTVDVHVQKLRKKLGAEDRIKTIYKVGYRFEGE